MDDSLKNNSKWGGKREGAGRPVGAMNQRTKDKKEAERELKQRIVENSQRILDKQLSLAEGCQYLFVIRYEEGENGKRRKGKPELVTDQEIIRDYLDGKLEGNQDEYYFMTTERPDSKVLDSLLDRAFGRASQTLDLESGGQPLQAVAMIGNIVKKADGE